MPHIPPEIIDIIIGFVPSATFYLDHRYKEDDISVLLDLSLVSRDWVFSSRRELFQRQHIVFDVQDSPRISDFVEILQGRDQLPNIPHILSFLSTITFITPAPCIEQTDQKKEQTLTFLRELTKRKAFFQPVTLRIGWKRWEAPSSCFCSASSFVPAIAEAFSTITHLDFDDHSEPDCSSVSLIAAFKELRELDIWYWAPPPLTNDSPSNEFLQTYRIPEILHTLQYTSTRQFLSTNHWYEVNVEREVEWLRSHPPLPQMRRLSFVNAAQPSVIQALIDICPELNALFLSHWTTDLRAAGGAIDLSRHKQLARLCVHISDISSYRLDYEEFMWNKIIRTVRTATSLRCSLEILFHASQVCEEMIGWWHLLGEAVSALPKDVVLRVRVISAHSSGGKKGEDFIRKVFRDLSNHRKILFGREEKLVYHDEPQGWRDFDVTDESTWKTITVKDE